MNDARNFWVGWLTLFTLTLFVGCGESPATVTGNVTVSDQPLAKGEIVFSPTSGGTPIGAPIVAGKYTAKLFPGDRTVVITETIETEPILSTEEMQRQAQAGVQPAPPPQSKISPATPGNSKTVTIVKGIQTMDFALQP